MAAAPVVMAAMEPAHKAFTSKKSWWLGRLGCGFQFLTDDTDFATTKQTFPHNKTGGYS